jgi:ELWxxDGT repeat protein
MGGASQHKPAPACQALEPRLCLATFSLNNMPVPTLLTNANGVLLYLNNDDVHGVELWRSDGTQAATSMVKDINPGAASIVEDNGSDGPEINAMQLVTLGADTYFFADDGIHGTELWKSNGTSAGTQLVRDLVTGPDGCFPGRLTVFKAEIYFSAVGPDQVDALWKFDGSSSFVRLTTTSSDGGISQFAAVGNNLYFVNRTEAGGYQLFRTDGTPDGTRALSQRTGINWAGVQLLSHAGQLFVFDASAVWRFDPAGGGALTKLLSQGAEPVGSLGGRLMFTTRSGDPYTRYETIHLWSSDGTTVGTQELWQGELETYAIPSPPDNHFTIVGTTLFFNAAAQDGTPLELWKSDGTLAGTKLVKAGVFSPYGGISNFVNFNGKLAFADKLKMWISDGTAAGTTPIGTFPTPPWDTEDFQYDQEDPPATHLTAVNDKLFFVGFGDTRSVDVYALRPGQAVIPLRTVVRPASVQGSTLTIDGSSDDDVIRVSLGGGTLTVNWNNQPPSTYNAASISGILIRAADGNDTVTLLGAINRATVDGGSGDDTLVGGSGNDLLDGEDGGDSLVGGGGDDTLLGGDTGFIIGSLVDTLDGGTGNDRLYAGNRYASLMGGSGDDYLQGADWNDTLIGGDGNDYMFGGRGKDLLVGGSGADTLSGWKDVDTVDYSDRSDDLVISLDGRNHDGGAGERDNVLSDVEIVLGGRGDDLIVGGVANDVLVGGAGNDTLLGMLGNDSLVGGSGNDSLNGDVGDDTLVGGSGNDVIDAGNGIDSARVDSRDRWSLIETLLS